ncbi:MAG: hypothetical protein K2N94_01845 [Lachnospiraceae bacterium]|nr:hypothetical protein [Lachnospiraceae bacterium]
MAQLLFYSHNINQKKQSVDSAVPRNPRHHFILLQGQLPILNSILLTIMKYQYKETLFKAFPAPDLRREAAYSLANPCASAGGSGEVLIKSALP